MSDTQRVLGDFHRTLVEEIRAHRPDYLRGPFTVAEIYQNLVPYGTHRDRIGVEMNGDYEDALLRLLAGEGGYLVLESEPALRDLREELESSNPNTGLYREFAAVDVRLNPAFVDPDTSDAGTSHSTDLDEPEETATMSMDDLAPLDGSPDEEVHEQMDAVEMDAAEATDDDLEAESSTDASETSEADVEACRWCRAELPPRENVNFCPFCGTDVKVIPCSSCGEELEPGWCFCVACGAEVSD